MKAVLTFLGFYIAIGIVVLMVGLNKVKGPDPLGGRAFGIWVVLLWPLAVLNRRNWNK